MPPRLLWPLAYAKREKILANQRANRQQIQVRTRFSGPPPERGHFQIIKVKFMKNARLWQVSEVTISYRSKLKAADRPSIHSARDAENILRANWSDDIELLEEFLVLFLNRANQVTGLFRASRGGTSGTVVDVKIIFAAALKALACGIIVAHNHPSGNLQPSQADMDMTRKIRRAGELLDISVLDHLILTHNDYYSFADEGTL
jgi:DNA repair protein RadC